MNRTNASTDATHPGRVVRGEAFPGALLILCAVVAMAIANSPWAAGWQHWWHTEFAIHLGDQAITKSVAHWINDGLMVLFFFFVGLEVKHEVLDGELQSMKQAALPVAAAVGGMIVPAGVYAAVVAWHGDPEAMAGWAIPMATDIAFALGVLALLGRRMPSSLRVFLASLAIADDVGAVLVIAIFYTEQIAWSFLGIGALLLALSALLNRFGVRATWPYVVIGLLLWATLLRSGVHATIAGVALAMTIPARRKLNERDFTQRGRELLDEFERVGEPDPLTNPEQLALVRELQVHATAVQAPLQRMTEGLKPLVAHLIVPVFALANAGVDVRHGIAEVASHPAARGVFVGLLLGKPLGILLAIWIAHRWLKAPLPRGSTWAHLRGVACLAGIGFTMSLFLDSLAFPASPEAFGAAKVAILGASLLVSLVGYFLLRRLPMPAIDTAH